MTAFEYNGSHKTIASDFPAQGEGSLTDIIVKGDRLYFGLGAATNSGVVGPDDWQFGWVKNHPKFSDHSLVPLKLLGYRFDAKNPRSGLLGGDDIANGAVPSVRRERSFLGAEVPDGKPTAAIYSANVAGGDVRNEAHGIRLPRGLAVDEWAADESTSRTMAWSSAACARSRTIPAPCCGWSPARGTAGRTSAPICNPSASNASSRRSNRCAAVDIARSTT